MKARIRKTGEIVNIAEYAKITLEQCDSWGNPIEMKPEEIELIQEPTENEHWQDIRNQAAIAAMQSIIVKCNINTIDSKTYKMVSQVAVEQADTLIEKLKKK